MLERGTIEPGNNWSGDGTGGVWHTKEQVTKASKDKDYTYKKLIDLGFVPEAGHNRWSTNSSWHSTEFSHPALKENIILTTTIYYQCEFEKEEKRDIDEAEAILLYAGLP